MAHKVLIVDDDKEIHQQLSEFLKDPIGSQKLELLSVYDAKSALSCILENPDIEVLLLDIVLPDVDGIFLLKELQQLGGFFSVVILSGNCSEEIVIEAMNYGVVGFIAKPLKHREEVNKILENAIRIALDKRSLLHNEVENNFLRLLNKWLQQEIKAKERAQQKVSLLTTALDQAADNIMITDHNGVILYVNYGFTQFTQYSKEEVLGKTPRILKSGEHDHTFYKKFWDRIKQGNTFRGEFINRKKNGELYWEDKTVSPVFDVNGKIAFFVSSGKDITEKKRLEQLRADTERLVKHDMKNPLNAIVCFSELLLESTLPDEQRQMLENIHQAALELNYLVNHSFDIFQMEEGTYHFTPEKVDLASVAKHTLNVFSHFATQRQIKLHLETSPNLPYILGSTHHLQSMCYNLVKNAIEASLPQQTVKVIVEHEANQVRLKIWNHLPIPEEIRERFFERYVTFGKPGGSGLGTYSAHLIARVHGGELNFTSSHDEGTTLIASFPCS